MREERILIVENECIIARDLEISLHRLGWKACDVAYSGPEAMETARRTSPHLVLMDIKLGSGMDGIEAAAAIAEFSDIPVIYLTAYADEKTLKRASTTQPYGYIVKPFDDRTLQVTIEMALYKHQVEQKLKEKEKWLSLIIDNLHEGVIAVDGQNRVRMMNPAACMFTGWKDGDFTGVPLHDVLHIIDPRSHEDVQLSCLESDPKKNDPGGSEGNVLVARDGSHTDVDCKNIPIMGHKGEVTGGLLVLHDITRHKRLESQLRQSQKMEAIGTLAGGIAHDFNNILSVILGYSDLLVRELEPGTRPHTYMDHVLTAAERARGLVKQILTFSRQDEQEKRPLKVHLIVKEVLKLLRSSLPSTIRIQSSLRAENSVVPAEPTHIHQVMMNLCTNAAHAMKEEGGELDVRLEEVAHMPNTPAGGNKTEKNGGYVCLTVRDTGCGMDARTMSRIFEPYYTTKKQGEGTGMGLAVIHGIVKGLGGDITVESSPGEGAVFSVYLPLTTGEEPLETAGEKEPPPEVLGGNERILFVDDEEVLVDLGGRILEPLGYYYTGISDSRKALQTFAESPLSFDVVITDLTMPQLTGIQLAREIIAIRPDIPIILITGVRNQEIITNAQESGVHQLIMKPLNRSELALAVRRLLDQEK